MIALRDRASPAVVCVVVLLPAVMAAQSSPARTVRGFSTAPGLEVTLWASEPQVVNPTSIDFDAQGRLWALDAGNGRITVLEDADGDGKADKLKIFEESPALKSALGIAVFGEKVVVLRSNEPLVYRIGEDNRIVSREGPPAAWKGARCLVFGPDGRWYFSSAGSVQRMDRDGPDATVLGHHFRNPADLAIDSFGTVWETDNDDAHSWTRTNYVMPGGDFDDWMSPAPPPGVVPSVGRISGGSPRGLVIYEGTLLPQKYRGHLLHAERERRLITAHFLSSDGAGYKLATENLLSAADPWFRPSDLAVGPDGAIYISDSYDSGAPGRPVKEGGRGRIYRLAPAGIKGKRLALDLDTDSGLAAALRSPAHSVRYLAHTRVKALGPKATPLLQAMAASGDAVARARALWLMEGDAARAALSDAEPNFRILALRILEARGPDLSSATRTVLRDPSPQVRREAAVLLRREGSEESIDGVAELARQWDGRDRWYLAALGIAGRGKENVLYAKLHPGTWDSGFAKLIWEWRPTAALPDLISRGRDQDALEALGVMPLPDAGRAVARLVGDREMGAIALAILGRQLFREWAPLRQDPEVVAALRRALGEPALQSTALDLIDDLEDPAFGQDLLALIRSDTSSEESRAAAIEALGRARNASYLADMLKFMHNGTTSMRTRAVRAIGLMRAPGVEGDLRALLLSGAPNEVRSEAVQALGRTEAGITLLLDLAQEARLPAELRSLTASVCNGTSNPQLRARAAKILPPAASKDQRPVPLLLVRREGDARRGRQVFSSPQGPRCSGCHSLGDGRRRAGPDLATIGQKLDREAMLDAILHPSSGIAPEFYPWTWQTKSQGEVTGVIVDDTAQRLVIRTESGEEIRIRPEQVLSRRRSNLSLMPEGLASHMTEQQIADLLEFLSTLKEPPLRRASQGR